MLAANTDTNHEPEIDDSWDGYTDTGASSSIAVVKSEQNEQLLSRPRGPYDTLNTVPVRHIRGTDNAITAGQQHCCNWHPMSYQQ